MTFTEAHEKRLARLDEIVRGNGDVGLRSRVKTLEEFMKAFKKDVRWLIRLAIGAIGVGLINIWMNSGLR